LQLIPVPGTSITTSGRRKAVCLICTTFATGTDLRLAALQIGAQLFGAALGAFCGLTLDFGLALSRLGVCGCFLGHDTGPIAQNRAEVKISGSIEMTADWRLAHERS